MTKTEQILKKKPKKWITNLIFTFAIIIAIVYSFSDSRINWKRFNSVGSYLNAMLESFADIDVDFLLGTGLYRFEEG
ncbi:MAG: hypothetical protein PHD24_05125, partial [Candidatus Izemoplasmatales bacterium]|nr:hypothetical protein [Candidatus Izemoplasmatales bacterium]